MRKSTTAGAIVYVLVRDGMLLKAVCNMLSDAGYDVKETEKTLFDGVVVCDDINIALKNKSAVFIGYEQPSEHVNSVLRPFTEDELVLAVDKIFESTSNEEENGIYFDKKRKILMLDGRKIALSEKETALFALLYENRGKTVDDAEIVEKVWKNETVSDSNIAAVYINYLRKKLENSEGNNPIIRVRGKGYMLK